MIWKSATFGAAIVAAFLGLALTQSYLENRHLVQQFAQSERRINDPDTGYVVQLAQSRMNAAGLKVSLDRLNVTLLEQASVAKTRLLETSKALDEAQRKNKENEARIRRLLLATPPKGNTLEDRYEDIDKRLLESLK